MKASLSKQIARVRSILELEIQAAPTNRRKIT